MKNIGTLDKKYTEFQQIWFIFCLFSMIRYRNQRMCCRENMSRVKDKKNESRMWALPREFWTLLCNDFYNSLHLI